MILAIYSHFDDSKEILKKLLKVPPIAEFLIIIYCKYLWRIKIFSFFSNVKDLNGIWDCIIKYENQSKEKTCEVKIKQDLFGIEISMRTDETNSWSVTSSIEFYHDTYYLVYVYKTETNKEYREKNRDQYGAVKLLIDNNKMKGEYWTNNKTDGVMELVKR